MCNTVSVGERIGYVVYLGVWLAAVGILIYSAGYPYDGPSPPWLLRARVLSIMVVLFMNPLALALLACSRGRTSEGAATATLRDGVVAAANGVLSLPETADQAEPARWGGSRNG